MESCAQDTVGYVFEVGLCVGLMEEGKVDIACGMGWEVGCKFEFGIGLRASVDCAECCERANEDCEVDYGD